MKIVTERPPNWAKLKEYFEMDDEHTVFTYGDTIYNPGNQHIDEYLHTHEYTHSIQQANEGGPDKWWERFIDSPTFRAEQEAQAYGQQYKHFCQNVADREQRAAFLRHIATDLASGLYRVSMTMPDAMAAIRTRAERKMPELIQK
jgi:hypothetical protein